MVETLVRINDGACICLPADCLDFKRGLTILESPDSFGSRENFMRLSYFMYIDFSLLLHTCLKYLVCSRTSVDFFS